MLVHQLAARCADVGLERMRLEPGAGCLARQVDLAQELWIGHRHIVATGPTSEIISAARNPIKYNVIIFIAFFVVNFLFHYASFMENHLN